MVGMADTGLHNYMNILLVHNAYAEFSGEEAVVESQVRLLEKNGHHVIRYERNSAEIATMHLGRLQAFFSGIYSFSSRNQMRKLLADHNPDIVHIHNLFPLISPSVLPECKKTGIPVVMTVHNYRLACPNGLFLPKGRMNVCERCCGGSEYWCVLRNCEQNHVKSFGYALRSYVARRRRLFLDNVTMYACLSEFQKNKLINEGISAARLAVVPNMVERSDAQPYRATGEYVGYVGRVSPEKGIHVLVKAAAQLPDVQFKAAGAYKTMQALVKDSPTNISFVGHLDKDHLSAFYWNCRFFVFPSICYEAFGLSQVEAALRGKPVISSRIGGIPEIVDDGETGLLFEPGNPKELAEKIKYLWSNPTLCQEMGENARQKAIRAYSPNQYYEKLVDVYENAKQISAERLGP
jgi:glycosyltransferase involved in cell wall biosynthesis